MTFILLKVFVRLCAALMSHRCFYLSIYQSVNSYNDQRVFDRVRRE